MPTSFRRSFFTGRETPYNIRALAVIVEDGFHVFRRTQMSKKYARFISQSRVVATIPQRSADQFMSCDRMSCFAEIVIHVSTQVSQRDLERIVD